MILRKLVDEEPENSPSTSQSNPSDHERGVRAEYVSQDMGSSNDSIMVMDGDSQNIIVEWRRRSPDVSGTPQSSESTTGNEMQDRFFGVPNNP